MRGLCRSVALAAAALGLGQAAPGSDAPAGSEVRVLLFESERAVRVGEPATLIEAAADGLRADSRAVGSVWRLRGDGPLRAGELRVRGSIEVHRAPLGLWVVNRVFLEDYVAATVGREAYAHWNPEMLKAQAVVARTYALHQRARHSGDPFDVRAGAAGQAYGGVDAETASALAATADTRGQYLAWRSRPILAVYHSASGGRTASAEEVWGRPLPYLVSRSVEHEEDSPDTYWRAAVSGITLGRALEPFGVRVGPVRELRIEKRSPSGRAARVGVRGRDGSESVEARALRTALGGSVIRSTLFEIRRDGDGFVFVGSGHGHGVGMSQWGAQAMAQRGVGYREILAHFYPGTTLRGGAAR